MISTARLTSGFRPAQTVTLTAMVVLFCCSRAFAHDPGLSSAEMTLGQSSVVVQLTFNDRDMAGLLGEPLGSASMVDGPQTKLSGTAARAATLHRDGISQTPSNADFEFSGENNVVFRITFPATGSGDLSFRSTLLNELSFGHRQAFVARDRSGREVVRRILSNRDAEVVIPLSAVQPAPPRSGAFLEFFRLGIHHIITGYDHLLFLFGLLIVCGSLRPAAVLITCFTIAHSITLALSTFGLVNLPSRVVEAVIAASILYVGIENLVRRNHVLRGRWLLTLVFGLVHGLGFAGVLHEMGIAKSGAAAVIPLLAFNSGVEVGQLIIAALVLPALWRLRNFHWFARIGVPACSVIVAAGGAYWLLERTLLG